MEGKTVYITSGRYGDRVGVIGQVLENAFLVHLNDAPPGSGPVAIGKEACLLIDGGDSTATTPTRGFPTQNSCVIHSTIFDDFLDPLSSDPAPFMYSAD